jgi:ankyrin repeat protein
MTARRVQVWFQNRRTKARTCPEGEQSLNIFAALNGVEEINKQDPITGNTLLILKAAEGCNSVQNLLTMGANPNLQNDLGWGPLYSAVINGHEKVIEVLLAKRWNCNINMREYTFGMTALHAACLVFQKSIITNILDWSRKYSAIITVQRDKYPLAL